MDLALNNIQKLICHKNPTNQPTIKIPANFVCLIFQDVI